VHRHGNQFKQTEKQEKGDEARERVTPPNEGGDNVQWTP